MLSPDAKREALELINFLARQGHYYFERYLT